MKRYVLCSFSTGGYFALYTRQQYCTCVFIYFCIIITLRILSLTYSVVCIYSTICDILYIPDKWIFIAKHLGNVLMTIGRLHLTKTSSLFSCRLSLRSSHWCGLVTHIPLCFHKNQLISIVENSWILFNILELILTHPRIYASMVIIWFTWDISYEVNYWNLGKILRINSTKRCAMLIRYVR